MHKHTERHIKLQTIDQFEKTKRNLICFDSGCGDLVIRKSAIDSLKKGPMILSGVWDVQSEFEHGAYSITLHLGTLSGICLDQITANFPNYPLKTVESDFRAQFSNLKKGFPRKLPNLPSKT